MTLARSLISCASAARTREVDSKPKLWQIALIAPPPVAQNFSWQPKDDIENASKCAQEHSAECILDFMDTCIMELLGRLCFVAVQAFYASQQNAFLVKQYHSKGINFDEHSVIITVARTSTHYVCALSEHPRFCAEWQQQEVTDHRIAMRVNIDASLQHAQVLYASTLFVSRTMPPACSDPLDCLGNTL